MMMTISLEEQFCAVLTSQNNEGIENIERRLKNEFISAADGTLYTGLARFLENQQHEARLPAVLDVLKLCCRSHIFSESICGVHSEIGAALMTLMNQIPPLSSRIIAIFSNCSLWPQNHNFLFTPEFNFVKFVNDDLLLNREEEYPYWRVCNLISLMEGKHLSQFITLKIHNTIYQTLRTCEISPEVCDRIFDFFVYFSTFSEGAVALQHLIDKTQHNYFLQYLNSDSMLGIEAYFILANLCEVNENNQQYFSSMSTDVLPLITNIFEATLEYHVDNEIVHQLQSRIDFSFGILSLRHITSALRNLSLSPDMKVALINNEQLLRLINNCLTLFNDGTKARQCNDGKGSTMVGGGGKDFETLHNIITLVVRLTSYFQDIDQLKRYFSLPLPFQVKANLETCYALPFERNIFPESKEFIKTLLFRIEPGRRLPVIEVSQKHIMVSYAWKTNKDLVVALAEYIKGLGYDVWRDETGSPFSPRVEDQSVDSFAAAIEKSYLMIVCYSQAYSESEICRAEAVYARKINLNKDNPNTISIKFVKMDEIYEPVGWLGFLLGDSIWYPLWSKDHVETTAWDLMKNIPSNTGNPERTPPKKPSHAATRSRMLEIWNNYSTEIIFLCIALVALRVFLVLRAYFFESMCLSSVCVDFQSAWTILDPQNTLAPTAFIFLLKDFHLVKAMNLKHATEEQLEVLTLLLKPHLRNAFRQAMRLQ
jgi:hypothetical protein